jgi:CheY-like chemotaxis protein
VLPDSVSAQSSKTCLEFLVVCAAPQVFTVLADAIHAVGGRLNCAPTCEAAADYVARRKVDGIILDMALPAAMEFLNCVRSGNSNKFSVVVACLDGAQEAAAALSAGANVVLHKPLDPIHVPQSLIAALPLMAAEKRRFFRYPLIVPVSLSVSGEPRQATMANLSEGGMAVWSVCEHPPGAAVEFSFTLPFGGVIHGQGEIAWSDNEGTLGIRFHILPDSAYTHLSGWLSRRDPRPHWNRRMRRPKSPD